MAQVTLKGNPVQVDGQLPQVGQQAPAFSLVAGDLSDVTLASLAGKRKVLNIFPSVDTPTCATSVRKFNAQASALANTVVLCVSADLPFAQARFCGAEGIDNVTAASATVPFSDAKTFVGCAGTFTTLSALAQGLESYDPARIHMSEIPFDRLREVTADLCSKTAAHRRENPVVHSGRADVIASGATVVEQLMDTFERDAGATSFIISEKDILDGIVAGLLQD